MKKTDIVILVSQKYVKEPYVDDIALKYLLEKKGCKTEIVAWDDLDYDFSLTHIALIRSCWDYDQRICEFIKKMKLIAQQTRLINPIDMILQNTNKLYLKKLKTVGVEIVPTVFISNLKEIEPTLQTIEWDEVIIKPVISASGRNTYKIKKQDNGLCYGSTAKTQKLNPLHPLRGHPPQGGN
ncbi:MAG: hypothetical protein U9N62_12675 [Thermotogota bacterium]|nr:hypothetical protein [Thermotogota bacterium]